MNKKLLAVAVAGALADFFQPLERKVFKGLVAAGFILCITPGAENPQQPSATSETFLPDQLIAGDFPRVTAQNVLITGAATLNRGTVLGQVSIGAGTAAAKGGGNTGNGTISAITNQANGQVGKYLVRFTAATVFTVTDPKGDVLATNGATGVAFADQVGFTITAGGTAFVAGDGFDITVAAGNGKYKLSLATAVDGSQVPLAILGDFADPTGGDVNGAIYLSGEFNANALIFDGTWTLATLTPFLRDVNIYIRTALPATGNITNL